MKIEFLQVRSNECLTFKMDSGVMSKIALVFGFPIRLFRCPLTVFPHYDNHIPPNQSPKTQIQRTPVNCERY